MSVRCLACYISVFCANMTAICSGYADDLLDFDTQVMPVLTVSGCNTGACHGAAVGRGGFQLSLYGSRPERDFEQITLALEGRRINRIRPDASLIIRKPSEELYHGGGLRLDIDSPGYLRLSHWIAQGAKRLQRRRLTEFQVNVSDSTPEVGQSVQVSPVSHFSDGRQEDCLPWTVLTAADTDALRIRGGLVTPLRPGRHILLARFLDRVETVELLVPLKGHQPTIAESTGDSIDTFINRRLALLRLPVAGSANADSLIRRLSLDLTGTLPSPELRQRYSSNWNADSRRRLIDELMNSAEFYRLQTWLLAQVFSVRSIQDEAAGRMFYEWLASQVQADTPVTRIAHRLVTATGTVSESPESGWYRVHQDPRRQAEYFSRTLMGVRLQCANCHDHPLDSWTQDDYHGLAAVFSRVRVGNGGIRYVETGSVIHPATGDPAVASLPAGNTLTLEGDLRRDLADWLISQGTEYIERVTVNRVWKQLMGRGLVEPLDDLRVTNPATHPQLLNWLVMQLRENDHQLRPLIRLICLSDAYARSSAAKGIPDGFQAFYPAAIPRPMSAEVYSDAVAAVLGNRRSDAGDVSYDGLRRKSRTLDLLGRCTEEECTSSSVAADDLSVQLHLLTGPLLNEQLAATDGPFARRVLTAKADGGVSGLISHFYVRALSREPARGRTASHATASSHTSPSSRASFFPPRRTPQESRPA